MPRLTDTDTLFRSLSTLEPVHKASVRTCCKVAVAAEESAYEEELASGALKFGKNRKGQGAFWHSPQDPKQYA
jgi:hypothetical protein